MAQTHDTILASHTRFRAEYFVGYSPRSGGEWIARANSTGSAYENRVKMEKALARTWAKYAADVRTIEARAGAAKYAAQVAYTAATGEPGDPMGEEFFAARRRWLRACETHERARIRTERRAVR